MSVTRDIKVYRGLYNTGEKINFSPITETVTGDILETWYSIEVSGGIPAKDMGVETTDGFVYPMFAIHGGRTYYYDRNTQESITLKGVLLNHEIDNSWIVVYAPKGNYGIGVPRPEIAYTENKDVRIHVGSSVDTIENDVLEQSEDFDFFEISISNGVMSDNFFTYGGTFSPTCTIEMMPTDKIAQGNFIRLEFKLYGIWQNFGVFYVKEPPESTSEYVSVSGIGMLEMCGDFIASDATKPEGTWKSSILSIKGLVHYIYDSFGVPVLFNFDVNRTETQRNYYQNSSIVIPHGIEEYEMESNGITYSGYIMKEGFTSVRNAISKLAVALYSNAVEIAGAIVIMHNDEHDFADCGCFEDDMIEEPVQRMNAYYCPYKVNVECQQMQMTEFSKKVTDSTGTTVKYEATNAPALMDTTRIVNILNEKVIDEARKIIYYPVTIAEDDGGWCDVTNLSPTYWGQMDFAKYPIHDFATLMALNKPFYYYPIETELNGYSPFVYAGAGIKIRINGTVRFVYVGTLDLSWEGGMFSMSISSPADIDLNGGNNSTTSSGASSSAGIGTLSVGVLNSMKKAKLLDPKSILGEKIADSTIENANIADATIGFEKVNKSFITDLTADNAYIENLTAKVAELGYLKADSADLKYATITNLEAVDGKIDTLEAKAITTDNLTAKVAELGYLTVDAADIKYANIELSNIETANVGKLFADVGLIDRATIVEGHITGFLDSVEVNAASITAGTLIADRILLRGNNQGVLYALNNFGELESQNVDTLDGYVLTDHTITADKIVAKSITSNEIDVENLFAQNITATSMTITGDSKFGPFGVSSDLAEIIALDTDHNQVSIGTKKLDLYSGVVGTEEFEHMAISSNGFYTLNGAGAIARYELSGFKIENDSETVGIKGEFDKIEFRDAQSTTSKIVTYELDGIYFTGVSNFTIGAGLKTYGDLTVNNTTFIEDDGISFVNSYGNRVKNIHMISASNNFELGYGGYNNKIGATNIYGNEIQLLTRGNITSNRQLKYLWTGAHFMNANQTATLNDKISNQLNGIVLVWSKYSNGAQNYEWNCFFIPKQIVTEQPGGGHAMYCIGSWPSYKYVYVNQAYITGSSANESKNNKINGVTVDSTNHVLRYVIGV